MRPIETAVAAMLALGGVRSIWVWSRRGFVGRDATDHVLYALHLTGRIGLWFAFAGLFAIYATTEVSGRAALDELAELRWYALVPLGLATLQFVSAFLLARRPER